MKITGSGCINFGKHKGFSLASPEVPTDYLLWAEENVDLDSEEMTLLLAEIERRRNPGGQQRFSGTGWDDSKRRQTNTPPPPPPKQPRHASPSVMLQVIAAGRKTLAKTHHPDTGGDPAQMVAINAAADYLESVARGIPQT